MKKLREKPEIIAAVIAGIIRAIGSTLRFEVVDEAGLLSERPNHPVIWAFWHNRIFITPYFYREYICSRPGTILTSASKDGEIIAQTMAKFGAFVVRGSSSKGARGALINCLRTLRAGRDLVITPDGPRGPRYEMQPGMVKIASMTGHPIFPFAVKYHKGLRLGTWDRFVIPLPFSKVTFYLRPLEYIAPNLDEAGLAIERERISKLLHPPGHERA